MKYIYTYTLLLLFVLFSHIYSYPTTPSHSTSSEDADNEQAVSFWYQLFNNRASERSMDHNYKRFLHDMNMLQRQRRFGNTKYGRRSLLDEEQD